MSRQDRRGVNERGESPYGARARKAIMMDNPRLVPHVRSKDHAERERERAGGVAGKREGGGGGGGAKERKGRKTIARRVCGTARGTAGWDTQCARVPQYSTIPACAPLRSCRYAAHPRISSPLGSHVIERSPSRGETQPIHILCSPLYILRRERKRERETERERETRRKRRKGAWRGGRREGRIDG